MCEGNGSYNIRQLQKIELGILLDVAAVCEQEGIPFFLGEGTLLGAVRHQGFIPWDDDVDILMKRPDYERFLQISSARLGSRYMVQHPSTVENYWSPFMKIRLLTPTLFHQTHIAHLTAHNGPYIDIFPLDFLPRDSGLLLFAQSCFIRFLRATLTQKLGIHPADGLKRRCIRIVARFCSAKSIHFLLEKAFHLHGGTVQPYLGNLASYHKYSGQVLPASAYASAVWLPFEGHMLPLPCGYEQILENLYGEYMTLPPPEEHIIKHHFMQSEH